MFLTDICSSIQKLPERLFISILLVLPAFPVSALEDPSQKRLLTHLKVDHRALQQAEAEFRALQARSAASAREIDDFQLHIAQLRQRVANDCRALSKTNQASLPKDLPCPVHVAPHVGAADIDIAAEQTTMEATASLDAELSAALGAFDESLLREQDRVKRNKPATDEPDNRQTSADGGADSQEEQSGAAGGKGGELADSENQSENGEKSEPTGMAGTGSTAEVAQQSTQRTTATGEAEAGATETATTAKNTNVLSQSGRGATGEKTSGESGAGPAHKTSGADIPEDIPDGSDDDIVARQLREAAEKETDPELKERLWEEYRKYKRGG